MSNDDRGFAGGAVDRGLSPPIRLARLGAALADAPSCGFLRWAFPLKDQDAGDMSSFETPATGVDSPQRAIAYSLERLSLWAQAQGIAPSPNETAEDLPTTDLVFMFIPYLLAVAYTQIHETDTHEKIRILEAAISQYEAFLHRARTLRVTELSDSDEIRILLSNDVVGSMTEGQRREAKIRRYKAAKNAENTLRALRQRGRADDCEDSEREAISLAVSVAVNRAVESLGVTRVELALLQHTQGRVHDPMDQPQHASSQVPPERRPPGSMPMNFTITSRDAIRRGVFQPSHILPTFTVEEWGEIESRRMQERAARQQEMPGNRADEIDDTDEAADEQTLKARNWDDWKDEHNRGSGNTLR
mmetsp:Transcript_13689/g.28068  ORF Transcript_13689/g.28068 Transcript_13689/m.28068 type:complete len:360 (-) Transcript_13689:132-1211(-)|eukprot:CAMPEP_0184685758 /NCGR_PEP_ID=MMETSP0312-20130426/20095_1 /TAXON_ID=31354 /ORGANISM="Compsopogon coeruleus, Strain SAG 36.94" /LENGTH=359 /DNA_ID=CAMNT_0027140189 /DNA_START=1638 /DNA_END=2717 /DNA_ORIENTATION=-